MSLLDYDDPRPSHARPRRSGPDNSPAVFMTCLGLGILIMAAMAQRGQDQFLSAMAIAAALGLAGFVWALVRGRDVL